MEFKNKAIAMKALEKKKKKGAQIHNRNLVVHTVREKKVPKDPAVRKKTKGKSVCEVTEQWTPTSQRSQTQSFH